jgi:hypothetical protein
MFVGGWGSTAPDHIYLFFLGKKKKKKLFALWEIKYSGFRMVRNCGVRGFSVQKRALWVQVLGSKP